MREQFRGLKCSRECALIDLEVTANFNCQQLNTGRLKVFDRTGLAYTSPVRVRSVLFISEGCRKRRLQN